MTMLTPYWRHTEMLFVLSLFLLALPMALSTLYDCIDGVREFSDKPVLRTWILTLAAFFLFASCAVGGC